jgi:hypothetical protein
MHPRLMTVAHWVVDPDILSPSKSSDRFFKQLVFPESRRGLMLGQELIGRGVGAMNLLNSTLGSGLEKVGRRSRTCSAKAERKRIINYTRANYSWGSSEKCPGYSSLSNRP